MPTTVNALQEQVTPIPSRVLFHLLNRLVVVAVVGCALIIIAIIGWSIPRGFDITDEAFYLLSYRYPHEYEASFSTYHLLVAKGLGLANCSLLTYRWLGLLVNVLSSAVFSWSFARWQSMAAPSSRRPLVLTICYVLLGSLLIFSIFPRTLSYNSLNSLFLLLGAAAMLQTLSRGPSASLWLLAAGIAAGLDVFVKPSTAFLTVGSEAILLLWCWKQQEKKVIAGALMLLGFGVVTGLLLYFARVQPPLVWYHHLAEEMSVIQTSGGYSMRELLPSYADDAVQTVKFIAYPVGPVLLLLLGLAWWWPRQTDIAISYRVVAFALLAGAGLYMGWQAHQHRWYTNAFLNDFQSLPLLLAMLLLAVGGWLALPNARAGLFRPRIATQLLPVSGWLFVLPFFASVGTNNDLRASLLIDIGPWFALLLLFTGLCLHRLPAWTVNGLLLLSAGWATEQISVGVLITPYRLAKSIRQQVVPVRTAGLATTLLVDSTTAAFFNQLTGLLAKGGFRPGDPIMAFYDAPGLAYMSGGVSPGMPWYFSGRDVRNRHALDMTKIRINKAYILTTKPLGKEMQKYLRAKGISFPQQYRLLGSLTNPYAAPLPRNANIVSVYVPL